MVNIDTIKLLAGLFIVIGILVFVIFIIKYTNYEEDESNPCEYPVDPVSCGIREFEAYCNLDTNACIDTCKNLNPESMFDIECQYNETCCSVGECNDICAENQDTSAHLRNGTFVFIINNYYDQQFDSRNYLTYSLNYIDNILEAVQMPSKSISVIPKMIEYNVDWDPTWIIRSVGGELCQFLSGGYPELMLSHRGHILSVVYNLDHDNQYTHFGITFAPDGHDGYLIYVGNDSDIKYVKINQNQQLELTHMDNTFIDEYVWYMETRVVSGQKNMKTFPNMFDIDTFNDISGLVEINDCNKNYLYFGSKSDARVTCGNDANNNGQCFKIHYVEEKTHNDDMMVVEGHMATLDNKYFNATKSNSESGNTVQLSSGEPTDVVYFRFIEDKGFVVGSSQNKTLVGTNDTQNKCSHEYQNNSLKMAWRYAGSYMDQYIYRFKFDYYDDRNVSSCSKYVSCG
jgi:hypothetical protein